MCNSSENECRMFCQMMTLLKEMTVLFAGLEVFIQMKKIQSSQIKINIRTLFNLLAREMNLDKAEDMIRNVSFIFSQDFL